MPQKNVKFCTNTRDTRPFERKQWLCLSDVYSFHDWTTHSVWCMNDMKKSNGNSIHKKTFSIYMRIIRTITRVEWNWVQNINDWNVSLRIQRACKNQIKNLNDRKAFLLLMCCRVFIVSSKSKKEKKNIFYY